MRRREFVEGLGAVASLPLWARAAAAQQPGVPVIGFLHAGLRPVSSKYLPAFHKGLGEAGYVVGRNVDIEYRFADGQFDRLPALAAELVQRRVSVIVTLPGDPAASAAKAATRTIPIAFVSGIDPVRLGYAASFNRPDGNMTGVFSLASALAPKQFEMLRRLAPGGEPIALLLNPTNANQERDWADVQQAAGAIGQRLIVVKASTERDLDAAFASLAQQHAVALLIFGDPFFASRSVQISALAMQHRVPAMADVRTYTEAGLLMTYGPRALDYYQQIGVYAGRILRGEAPADLPIVQLSRLEFVINLKTAKALALDLPPTLLALADEVIE
jgi:putative ABC transport system substrate-binding protein